jgi:hypothetical protein
MSSQRVEKVYEKYAWIILAVLGLLIFVGGIPHTLGNNSDPVTAENIIGMTLSEFKTSYTNFFNLYDYFFRSGGWSDSAFGFLVMVISYVPYRKGERWAWYSLLSVPVFFLGHTAITLWVGPAASGVVLPVTSFTVLSFLGVLLPIRKFFTK